MMKDILINSDNSQKDLEYEHYGVDFMEFWCADAKKTAQYYCDKFGFRPFAVKEVETEERKRISHAICQRDLIYVFTSSLVPSDNEFNRELTTHGDFVYDLALRVSDAEHAFKLAVSHGATIIQSPSQWTDETLGTIVTASVKTPFGTVHTFVDRTKYRGQFLPQFKELSDEESSTHCQQMGTNLTHVDHAAIVFPAGTVERAHSWYISALGFRPFIYNDDITGEGLTVIGARGGLRTLVVTSTMDSFSFKLVLVEPVDNGNPDGNQIQEFLHYNGGAGVQHVALHTEDIVDSVGKQKRNGVGFISVPPNYYDSLFAGKADFPATREKLQELGILVEVTDEELDGKTIRSFLLQTFTAPLLDRPTFFMEVISRKGASGFGYRTIKALFEAVEELRTRRQAQATQ